MSIRDISLSTHHSDHLQKKHVSESQNGQSNVDQDRGKSAAELRDRVEISAAARTAQEGDVRKTSEMELARTALRYAPSASEERLAEIRARLESGYYTDDKVAAAMAGKIVASIRGSEEL